MTEKQLKEYVNNNAKKIIDGIKNLKNQAKELEHLSGITNNEYDAEAFEAKAEAYQTALSLLFEIEV